LIDGKNLGAVSAHFLPYPISKKKMTNKDTRRKFEDKKKRRGEWSRHNKGPREGIEQ